MGCANGEFIDTEPVFFSLNNIIAFFSRVALPCYYLLFFSPFAFADQNKEAKDTTTKMQKELKKVQKDQKRLTKYALVWAKVADSHSNFYQQYKYLFPLA